MGRAAYSTHRTTSNHRKAVREGIEEQRGITAAKKTDRKDWLIVLLTWPWSPKGGRGYHKPARYKIVDEYKSEEILKRAFSKGLWTRAFGGGYSTDEFSNMFGSYAFMCEREVFNRCYRDLRL